MAKIGGIFRVEFTLAKLSADFREFEAVVDLLAVLAIVWIRIVAVSVCAGAELIVFWSSFSWTSSTFISLAPSFSSDRATASLSGVKSFPGVVAEWVSSVEVRETNRLSRVDALPSRVIKCQAIWTLAVEGAVGVDAFSAVARAVLGEKLTFVNFDASVGNAVKNVTFSASEWNLAAIDALVTPSFTVGGAAELSSVPTGDIVNTSIIFVF